MTKEQGKLRRFASKPIPVALISILLGFIIEAVISPLKRAIPITVSAVEFKDKIATVYKGYGISYEILLPGKTNSHSEIWDSGKPYFFFTTAGFKDLDGNVHNGGLYRINSNWIPYNLVYEVDALVSSSYKYNYFDGTSIYSTNGFSEFDKNRKLVSIFRTGHFHCGVVLSTLKGDTTLTIWHKGQLSLVDYSRSLNDDEFKDFIFTGQSNNDSLIRLGFKNAWKDSLSNVNTDIGVFFAISGKEVKQAFESGSRSEIFLQGGDCRELLLWYLVMPVLGIGNLSSHIVTFEAPSSGEYYLIGLHADPKSLFKVEYDGKISHSLFILEDNREEISEILENDEQYFK